MRTAGGRLGIVKKNVRPGDLICILFGCSVPVILRSDGDGSRQYEFLGESYVHKVMDGEAAAKYRRGREFSGPHLFELR